MLLYRGYTPQPPSVIKAAPHADHLGPWRAADLTGSLTRNSGNRQLNYDTLRYQSSLHESTTGIFCCSARSICALEGDKLTCGCINALVIRYAKKDSTYVEIQNSSHQKEHAS
jgi:hypothetical protein